MFISYGGCQRKRITHASYVESLKLAVEARGQLEVVNGDAFVGRVDQRSGLEERHRALRKEAIRDAFRKRFAKPMAVRESGKHERQQRRARVRALGEVAQRIGERTSERRAVADDVVA